MSAAMQVCSTLHTQCDHAAQACAHDVQVSSRRPSNVVKERQDVMGHSGCSEMDLMKSVLNAS